eukprot:scaffold994_cov226-Prasinococcus_capsulatus_cf.AAC.16
MAGEQRHYVALLQTYGTRTEGRRHGGAGKASALEIGQRAPNPAPRPWSPLGVISTTPLRFVWAAARREGGGGEFARCRGLYGTETNGALCERAGQATQSRARILASPLGGHLQEEE